MLMTGTKLTKEWKTNQSCSALLKKRLTTVLFKLKREKSVILKKLYCLKATS